MLTREEFNGRMRYLTIRETPVPKESKELEEQGYTIVRKAFNAKELKALRTEINQVYDERQPDSRMRDKPDTNTPHHFRYEMFNHSPLCQTIAGRREILDVIEPLLGEDCHIIANICWRNPPGEMELNGGKWHLDGGPHIPLRSDQVWPENLPHPVFAIGAHIFLTNCPRKCGPTGVIPGSHKSGTHPPVVGLSACGILILISTSVGLISGYFGGVVDLVIQRFVDAWLSLPGLFVILTVMTTLGAGMPQTIGVLGAFYTKKEIP